MSSMATAERSLMMTDVGLVAIGSC